MPEGTKKSNRKDVAEQKRKNLADIGSKGAFQINVPILFICILLATLFWLFNRLAEDFKYDYSYQLSYLNQSEEKIFVCSTAKKDRAQCKRKWVETFKTKFIPIR